MSQGTTWEWTFLTRGKVSEGWERKRWSSTAMGLNSSWNGKTKENNEIIRVITVNLSKK